MTRYRGSQQQGNNKPGVPQAVKGAVVGAAPPAVGTNGKKQQRRKLKDSDDEDLTSSNGLSGTEDGPMYSGGGRVRRGGPHHRSHHGKHNSHSFSKYERVRMQGTNDCS
jgi:hypothetical protein